MIAAALIAAAPAPPADPTTTYVILGGASLFIIYTMMRLTKRKKADPFDKPFTTRSLSQQRSVERQFESLLVEFSEMSRQMTAQLDTRSAKLEALIKDADERVARLETLARHAPPRPNFAIPPEPATPTLPAAAAAVIVKADDMAPSPTIDAGHAEVYRLADEGEAVSKIAASLGRPSGEIELILALRQRA